jgi:Rrf2 family cysteine metabolism transcriptional repressor
MLLLLLLTIMVNIISPRGKSMKLTTRTRYGTRALLELAMRQGERPVFLKDIARQQGISLPYLEHLVAPLIAAGIIRSAKGPKGGVSLARRPEDIKLSEIMQLFEGSVAPVECVNNPEVCQRSAFCVTRDVWSRLKEAMDDVLESTTLQDLVEKNKKKGQIEPSVYHI